MKANDKNEMGFSIIEVLIVAAIASGMIFVVASFSSNLDVLQNVVSQKLQSRSDVGQTIQIMTTEIRSAGQSGNGAYAVDAASTSSLSFYSDTNKDGVFERVRYYLGTSTIRRGVITPTSNPLVYATSSEVVTTAVNYVISASSTPLFSYYDSNYTGTEAALSSPIDVSKVRVVKFSFYADVNPGKSPKPLFFSDTITIRNLRSN